MITPTRLSNQHVGNAGLYYVCYKLTLLGWNVLPTARNARGIDIVAYSDDGQLRPTIQVKTLSKRDPVPLGSHLDHLYADYVVICRKVASEPQTFVLTPDEVKKLVHQGERAGTVSYWLQPAAYEAEDFREQWGRIGLPR